MDILQKIPATVRKEQNPSAYKASRWKDFGRSPIRTRAQCKAVEDGGQAEGGTDKKGEEGEGRPPTLTRGLARTQRANESRKRSTRKQKARTAAQGGGQNKQTLKARKPPIQDQPYCTQQCLLGLTRGGPVDRQCPNVHDHKAKHIRVDTFRRLVRKQLAEDRRHDADCTPLYIQGARGALFKIRLSSHGYTFVAKGMEADKVAYLQHEERVYSRMGEIQGRHVPVCMGAIDLKLPYYYNSGVYVRMLFLSWAGQPVFNCTGAE